MSILPGELMAGAPENLSSGASHIRQSDPAVWTAFAALGLACAEAGPIDGHTLGLVKLALAIGALSEGAVHSHAGRALVEGLSRDELKHVAPLAIRTLGLPQDVKALTWIRDIPDLPAEQASRAI